MEARLVYCLRGALEIRVSFVKESSFIAKIVPIAIHQRNDFVNSTDPTYSFGRFLLSLVSIPYVIARNRSRLSHSVLC